MGVADCDPWRKGCLMSAHGFDDFASLRTRIVEDRACKFLGCLSDHATPDQFQCLLDLRGQDFKLNVNSFQDVLAG
jgi:hypothetical protein